jgi:hypothetical protein
VDGPPGEGHLVYRDAGPIDVYKKRYNVAVSRARDQLWVVYSIDPDVHLKSGDLRRRLIEHAPDPQALLRELDRQGARTESPFERMVLQRLVDAGPRPGYGDGSRLYKAQRSENRALGTGHSPPTTPDDEQRVQRVRLRALALREYWS